MVHATVHSISSLEFIHVDDWSYESHFFDFPTLADRFSVKFFFPTDESEFALEMPIGVSVPPQITEADLRFRYALQAVNLNYTPKVDAQNQNLFPNIKLNCALHNCCGVLHSTEAARIRANFIRHEPMILFLTNVEHVEGNIFSMFRQLAFDSFLTIKQAIGVEKTHVLWQSRNIDLWLEEETGIANIMIKAKCVEPWQKHCISNVGKDVEGLDLWRKMEKYASINFKPWKYLEDMLHV